MVDGVQTQVSVPSSGVLFVFLFVLCCLSGRWRSDSGFSAVIGAFVCLFFCFVLFVCFVLFEW